ncbi:MAG: hypothetical protein WKF96_17820 [Solirubrobacteraceae bacterium]
MAEHCADNALDRALGETWERNFARLAGEHGLCFTPHQIGRPDESASAHQRGAHGWQRLLLPDVTVWSAPGEHHEIKHKDATRHGTYGLERYRLEPLVAFALETDQDVLYTIHDWRLAGASSSREAMANRIEHWRTADVLDLAANIDLVAPVWTWRGGRKVREPGCYWSVDRWAPLAARWRAANAVAA